MLHYQCLFINATKHSMLEMFICCLFKPIKLLGSYFIYILTDFDFDSVSALVVQLLAKAFLQHLFTVTLISILF